VNLEGLNKVAGETVIVCCKLPNGLHLDLPGARRVTVRGPALEFGKVPSFIIAGGFALTPDVPQAHWDEWLKTHEGMDIVTKGFIFAHKDQRSADAHAREMAQERTGLEALDPDKPGPGLEKVSA
jgi:hypothetical protein